LKICLLSYRGNPYSGGQGIYVYYLSRELHKLGHEVHVLSGPPYPDVVEGVKVHKLESLNLYESIDRWGDVLRIRTPLRLYEYLAVAAGTFPEPFTFSIRAYNRLRALMPQYKFDIVHDNQCLAYGLLLMKRLGIPVVATIHHPIPIDKEIDLSHAKNLWDRFRLMRWYSFLKMQHRVSPRLDRVITVSNSSAEDIKRFFHVPEELLRVVYNGVDTDFFNCDGDVPKEPHSLMMVSTGQGNIKGLPYMLQALHLLKDEIDVKLTIVGTAAPDSQPAKLVREYGLEGNVSFTGRIEREELATLYTTAEVAVSPSLYEGFGLPAAEAMSSGVPVIAARAGALPEVVGKDGETGILVPPAQPDALAAAIKHLLSDNALRKRLGEAGRRRVQSKFSWEQAAKKTVEVYEELL
jgi:glycosyltransferase involved in cell wall biosynthesis